MTYHGHIENGVVVLDGAAVLPEGAEVTVNISLKLPSATVSPTFYEAFSEFFGSIDGLPEDFAENHEHYVHGTPKRP